MRMRRVYLSMPTEGTKAFSNGYGAVVWKGEVWTQIFLKTEQNNVWERPLRNQTKVFLFVHHNLFIANIDVFLGIRPIKNNTFRW